MCALLFRVRHEAAEALGAIAAPDCLQLLQEYSRDPCQEVAETCQLALGRLKHLEQKKAAEAAPGAVALDAVAAEQAEESPYYSVDPTPALPASTPTAQLRDMLLNPAVGMFEVSCQQSLRHV
jgi:deoxyhypusine monooxygenase